MTKTCVANDESYLANDGTFVAEESVANGRVPLNSFQRENNSPPRIILLYLTPNQTPDPSLLCFTYKRLLEVYKRKRIDTAKHRADEN